MAIVIIPCLLMLTLWSIGWSVDIRADLREIEECRKAMGKPE